MISVNHDLNAIYIHIPKTGGEYIANILNKYYGFETYNNIIFDYYGFVYEDDLLHFPHNNRGVTKYYMNSKHKMTKEIWNTYIKFAFVRNPYTKIISSYEYSKYLYNEHHYKNDEFIQFPSFSTFIKNQKYGMEQSLYENSLNLYCYHYYQTFITQYEHLLDNDNKINIDYIGQFENLNEELIDILTKIGVKNPIKHLNELYNNNNNKPNKTNKDDISQYIDNELLTFINDYYDKDFELYKYKKYYNINDLSININFDKQNEEFLKKNNLLIEKYIDNNDLIFNATPIRKFLYKGLHI